MRAIDCPCGHRLQAADDEKLFRLAREHVERDHPEMQRTDDQIRERVSRDAHDVWGRRMAKILYYSVAGSNDPGRAVFPFIFAQGALDEGHEAEIFLAGEAVYLMKDEVAQATSGVGWPSAAEAMKACADAGVPLYI